MYEALYFKVCGVCGPAGVRSNSVAVEQLAQLKHHSLEHMLTIVHANLPIARGLTQVLHLFVLLHVWYLTSSTPAETQISARNSGPRSRLYYGFIQALLKLC